MRKIAVITGTRAEYGLLFWVMKGIHEDPGLELQLIVTGMHLSPEFGLTVREIEKNGFPIAERVEMLLSSDTEVDIAAHIISEEGYGVPGSTGEMFSLLGEKNILDPSFAYKFAKIAGFRNLLAHDYEKIEAGLICENITIKLEEVDLFIRQIGDHL